MEFLTQCGDACPVLGDHQIATVEGAFSIVESGGVCFCGRLTTEELQTLMALLQAVISVPATAMAAGMDVVGTAEVLQKCAGGASAAAGGACAVAGGSSVAAGGASAAAGGASAAAGGASAAAGGASAAPCQRFGQYISCPYFSRLNWTTSGPRFEAAEAAIKAKNPIGPAILTDDSTSDDSTSDDSASDDSASDDSASDDSASDDSATDSDGDDCVDIVSLVSEACEVVSRGKCGCCKESEAQFETMKALVEAAAGCLALDKDIVAEAKAALECATEYAAEEDVSAARM
jgi:hypothetical protein